MTRVGIPFNEWSLERLLDGRKTATSRNKKYGKAGDVFIIRKKVFKLISIEKMKLIIIAKFHYKEEGAKYPEEFIEIWKQIHPKRGWEPDKRVWFHKFEQIYDLHEVPNCLS